MLEKRICLAVTNDMVSDQRVHRIATTLTNAGAKVTVIGRKRKRSLPIKQRAYQVYRMKLLFEKGKLFYLEYNLRLFWRLLFEKVDVITANDLDTLLACYLAAKLRAKPLVYDSHEYFTQVPELVNRPKTQKIWLTLERWIFPKLLRISTVSQSIADEYHRSYGKELTLIRNLPFRQLGELQSAKSAFDAKILLYQGAVNLGRGVDLMIQACELLPNWRLWIIGEGDKYDEMREFALKSNLQERVKFFGLMPFERLAEFTKQATLGLSLEEDLGLNYRFAAPNKLFDYIQCGLPIIASPLPEMVRLTLTHRVGRILNERSPQALAQIITQIELNPTEYFTMRDNALIAAQTLTWEKEQEKLLKMYE